MSQLVKLEQEAEIGGVKIPAGASIEIDLDRNSVSYQGTRIEASIGTSDVREPTELPTYIAGYSNEEFRHEEICPVVLVDKDEDKYRTWNEAAAFQPAKVKTDDESDIQQITIRSSLSPYKVQPRRIGAFIPKHVARQQPANMDVKRGATERCKRVMNMDLEADTANLLFTAGNWGASMAVTLPADQNWEDGPNSNPVKAIRARVFASYGRIARWWMNPEVAAAFLDNDATRSYLALVNGQNPIDRSLRSIRDGEEDVDFAITGLGRFSVDYSRWLSPVTGQMEWMVPDGIVGVSVQSEVDNDKIATCKRFRRKDDAGVGFNVRELEMGWRGAGGTLVIVEEASDEVMTGKLVGGLILGVLP